MPKKLSTKLIIIFILIFIALAATAITSNIAINTQRQHLIFTELVSEVTLLSERITAATKNTSDMADIDQELFRKRADIEKVKNNIARVEEILANFRAGEVERNGEIIDLNFRGEFLEILNAALNDIDDSWENIKEKALYLNNPDNLDNLAEYRNIRANFNFLSDEIMNKFDYLVEICVEEAEMRMSISNNIQLLSLITSIIIFLLFIFLIIRSFYRPILEIKKVFKKMGQGEIKQKFVREQDDEFGELYKEFNHFIDNLNFIFSLEDQIMNKNRLDKILNYIYENFKRFIPFL